ncbi:Myb-like DNA-binding domain containing protein [Histomonas meleagridis]|uniref:Myb-like DNA-binding domain containing protein n=1 Tax=Histomonas meleagridis TaxID=135588 RepID=UPI00355AB4BD|nr:Myb-like DNA-binding domain containing protein [Histomonas meleagridis]KAH0805596.1 Myb-like DNA-binding domain containing protein [Histomonas meleagridis]
MLPPEGAGIQKENISFPVNQDGSNEHNQVGSVKQSQMKLPDDFETWTPCKKQAWLQMESNPNSFFYRHVLPGEERKLGHWTEEEKKLFIQALKIHPPSNGHWGLFSRLIPGRVGYQCSTFYNKLVQDGEISKLGFEVPVKPDTLVRPKDIRPSVIKNNNTSQKKSDVIHTNPQVQKNNPTISFSGNVFAYQHNPIGSDNFLIVPDLPKENIVLDIGDVLVRSNKKNV